MRRLICAPIASMVIGGTAGAWAHSGATSPDIAAPFGSPVDDQRIYVHALLEQFEYRAAAHDNLSRWDGEAWLGTDANRLWVKSEGEVSSSGDVVNGRHELIYDRPTSSYFDLQAGLRVDLDSAPSRTWAAIGVEGLAPYFLHLSVTAYASDGGHVAGKALGSCNVLLTQRLILQPRLEMNLYGKGDPQRGLGSGLTDLDIGLRLRYEFRREFAPYVGLTTNRAYGETADIRRASGEDTNDTRVVAGVRVWF